MTARVISSSTVPHIPALGIHFTSLREVLIENYLHRGGGAKLGATLGLAIGIAGLISNGVGTDEAGNLTLTSDEGDFGSWIEGVADS